MTKTLLVMRHAKSSWDLAGQKDFVRPLNKRGRQAASLMGQFLQEQKLEPDFILSSPAQRTRETLEKLRPFLSSATQVSFSPALYLASARLIRAEIASVPDHVNRLMILGHNPGLWDLSQFLWSKIADSPTAGNISHPLLEKFPTAAIAHFECPLDHWADLSENTARLCGFYRPKHLMLQDQDQG